MKLYSDVLKGIEMESTETPIVTAQGISLAFEYDINVIPGTDIKRDIELAMDQMKRFVYGVMIYSQNILTIFPP